MLQTLQQADDLYRQGRRDEAEQIYRQALQTQPANFEALHRLAVLELQRGQPIAALGYITSALALRPDDASALSDFGLIQVALGDSEGALESFDRALSLNPVHLSALRNRGRMLQALGRLSPAIESYDSALSLSGDDLDVLNNRAVALQALGRLDEALAGCERALVVKPDYPEALSNRGNLLRSMGRPVEALASYDLALAAKPDFALVHNNRGNLLRDLDRAPEALTSYERALVLHPSFAEAHRSRAQTLLDLGQPREALASCEHAIALNAADAEALNLRGVLMLGLNRPDEALASYELALAFRPDFADAAGNKGMLLVELGRFDEAREALERSIALAPGSARAYYNLTLATRMEAGDPHLATMLALERDGSALSIDDRIHLKFALAKAFADVGDHPASFDRLAAGSALKRSRIVYDEAMIIAGFERTRAAFSRQFMRKRKCSGDPSPVPVFIVGMPRSGTTLVEQILASHPRIAAAGESDDLGRAVAALGPEGATLLNHPEAIAAISDDQLRQLGQACLRQITAGAPQAERITNKTPENFHHLGLINLALPNARLIHVRRDPMDTCLSCYSKLFGGDLPYTYDLAELGRYYRAYETLMAHWRAVMPDGVMLEVQYEDLVDDIEGQARRIVDHVGLDWDARCLDFHLTERWVHTASASQVRQPIYKKAVGRWRAHEAHLQPLIVALGLEIASV